MERLASATPGEHQPAHELGCLSIPLLVPSPSYANPRFLHQGPKPKHGRSTAISARPRTPHVMRQDGPHHAPVYYRHLAGCQTRVGQTFARARHLMSTHAWASILTTRRPRGRDSRRLGGPLGNWGGDAYLAGQVASCRIQRVSLFSYISSVVFGRCSVVRVKLSMQQKPWWYPAPCPGTRYTRGLYWPCPFHRRKRAATIASDHPSRRRWYYSTFFIFALGIGYRLSL